MPEVFYPWAFSIYQLKSVDELRRQIGAVPSDRLAVLYTIENVSPAQIQQLRSQLKDLDSRLLWILPTIHQHQAWLGYRSNVRYVNWDWVEQLVYRRHSRATLFNDSWNPHTGRFLFLTGKPYHANRARLLWKFQQQALLDCCEWSLFYDQHLLERARHLLPELNDDEYLDFFQNLAQTPDGSPPSLDPATHCAHDGYPFDVLLYQRTSFRVVPETMSDGCPVVTGKTWITMGNHQPFILAGYPDTLAMLRQHGYRTFEQYLPRGDYDCITDDESRLNAVVENTDYWCRNIAQHQHSIEIDVQHNFDLLSSDMEKSWCQVQEIINILGCEGMTPARFLPITLQRSAWLLFYYRIKDPSWPDCYTHVDFQYLPSEIQRECREIFGYKG